MSIFLDLNVQSDRNYFSKVIFNTILLIKIIIIN